MADGIGCRPRLIAGLSLYPAAGGACAFAPNVVVLFCARLTQALGGCSSHLLGRAIVGDTSEIDNAVKQLTTLGFMMMTGPGLAQIIGAAWVASGKCALFVALCGFGVLNVVLLWCFLPERGRPSGRVRPSDVVADYGRLLRSRSFVGYAIGGGCATTTIYAFLALATFIYVQQIHRPVFEVALYVALLTIGMAIRSQLTRMLGSQVRMDG